MKKVKMKKSNVLLLIVVFSFVGTLFAGAVINVPPEDGMLSQAVDFASSGDTLLLESGGVYTTTGEEAIEVTKPVIIKPEDGAEEKPRIEMHVLKDLDFDADFFLLKDGAGLHLENVELYGFSDDTTTYETAEDFICLAENASVSSIKLFNSNFHHSSGKLIYADEDNSGADTVLIDNCLVNMCEGGPHFDSGKLTGLIKVTNSTFANLFDNRFVRAQSQSEGDDCAGIIDHCTVYNVAGKRMIMGKENTKKWVVTNSIFSVFTGSEPESSIRPGDNEADSLAFCILHDKVGLDEDWDIVSDTSSADPMFADPDNGDFTLMDGSPALNMASDGGAIGDPRWVSSTAVEAQPELANSFVLEQNYPNPFNPSTTISFTLNQNSSARITVYNIIGQLITTLLDKQLSAGHHAVQFDASHLSLSSGIYFYRLETDKQTAVRKMILMQ